MGGLSVRLGFSIGVCELVSNEPLGDLLRRVDRALYRAKESGRVAIDRALADQVLPAAMARKTALK